VKLQLMTLLLLRPQIVLQFTVGVLLLLFAKKTGETWTGLAVTEHKFT
jgi:uncharacterized membrane protein